MALNEELDTLVGRVEGMDREPTADEVDNLERTLCGLVGQYPSLELLKDVLDRFKAKYDNVIKNDIPCVLAEYGIQRATMADGTEVSTETFYETKQGDKALLAQWLTDIGAGAIIKDTFAFEKGEADSDLVRFLAENGYAYNRDSNVNGMSLKKVVKDYIDGGNGMPPAEAVAVSVYAQAKIKRPKKAF